MTSKTVTINFIDFDGTKKTVQAPVGLSILEAAHKFKVNLEGACEGSLACSTCHVILEQGFYDKLPPASEDEEDMLDLAFGLTHTSRLGCQIIIDESMDGITVSVPKMTRNMMLS